MTPGPGRMLVSDVRWRRLTMDEQTLVGKAYDGPVIVAKGGSSGQDRVVLLFV